MKKIGYRLYFLIIVMAMVMGLGILVDLMGGTLQYFLGILIIYFVPSIIALVDKKKNTSAIFLLNFFTGWTLVGWVVALVWAATKD